MKNRRKKTSPKPKAGNSSPRRKAKAAEKQAPVRTAPTEAQIRERAYHRFLERGGQPGHALEDWVAAERELGASAN